MYNKGGKSVPKWKTFAQNSNSSWFLFSFCIIHSNIIDHINKTNILLYRHATKVFIEFFFVQSLLLFSSVFCVSLDASALLGFSCGSLCNYFCIVFYCIFHLVWYCMMVRLTVYFAMRTVNVWEYFILACTKVPMCRRWNRKNHLNL